MTHEPTRILIVDDSRIFRGILESTFANISDIVVLGSVFNGEKAIEFLKKTPVDLVTLDLEMPGLDGLATLRAIRELNRSRPNSPPIEVILISSLTTQGARCTVEGLQLGAIDFVLKPSSGTEAQNKASLEKTLLEKLQIFKQKRFGRQRSAFKEGSDTCCQNGRNIQAGGQPFAVETAGNIPGNCDRHFDRRS